MLISVIGYRAKAELLYNENLNGVKIKVYRIKVKKNQPVVVTESDLRNEAYTKRFNINVVTSKNVKRCAYIIFQKPLSTQSSKTEELEISEKIKLQDTRSNKSDKPKSLHNQVSNSELDDQLSNNKKISPKMQERIEFYNKYGLLGVKTAISFKPKIIAQDIVSSDVSIVSTALKELKKQNNSKPEDFKDSCLYEQQKLKIDALFSKKRTENSISNIHTNQ